MTSNGNGTHEILSRELMDRRAETRSSAYGRRRHVPDALRRQGKVTEEMSFVAEREKLPVGLIRDEIAASRLIIPANINHPRIGTDGNWGGDQVQDQRQHRQLRRNLEYPRRVRQAAYRGELRANTVIDLSSGGKIPESRRFSPHPVPIGTIPIYEALNRVKKLEDLNIDVYLEVIEEQAQQGVDYFTVHAGVLIQYVPMVAKRITGIVSGGGAILARWMTHHHRQNFSMGTSTASSR